MTPEGCSSPIGWYAIGTVTHLTLCGPAACPEAARRGLIKPHRDVRFAVANSGAFRGKCSAAFSIRARLSRRRRRGRFSPLGPLGISTIYYSDYNKSAQNHHANLQNEDYGRPVIRLKHWIDGRVFGHERPEQTESAPKCHKELLASVHDVKNTIARPVNAILSQ